MKKTLIIVAAALSLFWGIWTAGYVVGFNSDGETPPERGRGEVTTIKGVND